MPSSSTHTAHSKSSPASVKPPAVKCPSSTAAVCSPSSVSGSPMPAEGGGGGEEAGGSGEERAELLGSLTTQAHQRTSARVIKKLKLDDQDRERKDTVECELQKLKESDAESEKLAALGVKQRTKALWSADEKNLFFEALNEYGKDFDSITAYICNKMKKKGVSDSNLKTKNQVSHFYYRTWHKLSKHVHFDESVKKVAQELYALINYGELRRRVGRLSDKWCARVGELARAGALVLRARGRTLRLRTPPCRALRHLNQISEEGEGLWRVWRVSVSLRSRSRAAWSRVLAAGHNPRLRTSLPPRTKLQALLQALHNRWTRTGPPIHSEEQCSEGADEEDLESQLYLPTERELTEECGWLLHVAPPARASPSPATLRPAPLAHRALCYSSYLQRLGAAKIPPPKRQRKDSASEREGESKRARGAPGGGAGGGAERAPPDDAAVDVDMMRGRAVRGESASEREKGSQSEDENKSESETETERRAERPLKVKFRIGPLEGAHKWELTDPCDKAIEDPPKSLAEEVAPLWSASDPSARPSDPPARPGDPAARPGDPRDEAGRAEAAGEARAELDVQFALRQIRRGWSALDAGDLTIGDLYLMFGSRSKLELDYWWAEPTPPLPQPIVARPQPSRPTSELDKTPPTSERDKKPDKTPEKEQGEDDIDAFSPKNIYNQDSNDGMSGDERKERESGGGVGGGGVSLCLASKLLNRPDPSPPARAALPHRLQALLRLAGNPLVSLHAHAHTQAYDKPTEAGGSAEEERCVFRHPTPIAPKPGAGGGAGRGAGGGEAGAAWRVGGARRGGGRARRAGVVVQRLLPLSPRDTRAHNLIPVKLERQLPKLLPKPSPPYAADGARSVFVVQERDGQYYCTDASGERRVLTSRLLRDASIKRELKEEAESLVSEGLAGAARGRGEADTTPEGESASTLPEGAVGSESLSLSPGRLLSGAWADADCSLSSFLAELDGAARHTESPLTSLLAESSIDYVAKFADLAAELEAPTEPELDPPPTDLVPAPTDLVPAPTDLVPDPTELVPDSELAVTTAAEPTATDHNTTEER